MRRIVYGLRPKALDELGLVGAVRQRVSTCGRRTARDARHVSAPAQLPDLPAAVEVAAYRVAVEAVTNVARHAGVTPREVWFASRTPPTCGFASRDARCLGRRRGSTASGCGRCASGVAGAGGVLRSSAGQEGAVVTADLPLGPGPATEGGGIGENRV